MPVDCGQSIYMVGTTDKWYYERFLTINACGQALREGCPTSYDTFMILLSSYFLCSLRTPRNTCKQLWQRNMIGQQRGRK